MKFKDGVYPEVTVFRNGKKKRLNYSKEVQHSMDIADALSKEITGKEAVCTGIFDGKHKDGSKHYIGDAWDMRRYIYNPYQTNTLHNNLIGNLGNNYDVVLHPTHFHIEYDPK